MKYITTRYARHRENLLTMNYCKRFFKFASLPELKFCKTLGFVLTILF